MRILITGNMGYIGPTLERQLHSSYPGVSLIGYDMGYFAHCLTGASRLPETRLSQQVIGDMRDFPAELLDGVDAVVHLAAISNDPMGKSYEDVTADINHKSSVRLAEMAKSRGVSHFVFASSCSMYGFAEGGPRREDDDLNPLTAYARSKVYTERDITPMADDDFTVTCLRFATACGMTDRLRLDLVLNDFVAGAVASKRIGILSDGSPWRPLITVDDMSLAMAWGVSRDSSNGGAALSVNTGSNEWNYQVVDLAQAVAKVIPDLEISVNKDAMPDKRSYRVNFDLYKELAPDHQPRVDLTGAIEGLKAGLERMQFGNADFRESQYMRLKVLAAHRGNGDLDEQLRWADNAR